MPFDTHYFIIVLKCFNYLEAFISNGIRDNDILIKTSTCYISSISRKRYASYFSFMELLMRNTLTHVKVPKCNWTIVVTNWCLANSKRKFLIWIFVPKRLWRAETYFIHFWKLRSIHFINILLASDIPNFYSFINTDRNSKWTIIRGLDWIDITLMSL